MWRGVGLLLDALGPRGTSDDETDNDSEHANPDSCFKTLRRVDTGFLSPAIAEIWASVETYPSSLRLSRGNRSFKRIARAKSIGKRTLLPSLPRNFYSPMWLQECSPHFRRHVKADVPLPVLVSYYTFIYRTLCLITVHRWPTRAMTYEMKVLAQRSYKQSMAKTEYYCSSYL